MTLAKAETGQEDQADRGFSPATATAERPPLKLTVSVVICAHTTDSWEDLKRTVASVGKETPDEIVLVIDHCPELLTRAEFLAQLLPWNIIVAPNRFERGLSGARNTGMAISQGDIVAFLDEDAAADPGWLAAMADHYQDSRVLGVGGMVRPDWEDGRPSWFAAELDWMVGCCYRGMPASSVPVRSFRGASMSFRCTVLEDCGGFSSVLGRGGAIPPGYAETELCLRIGQRHPDGILLYEPASTVSREEPSEHAEWRYLRSRCYAEGLSRAMVRRLAGPSRASGSGRSYVRPTLPRGIWGCLTHAPGGRLSGVRAALTMVMAVAVTALGYLAGWVTSRRVRAYRPLADDRPGTAPAQPQAPLDAAPDDTIQFIAAAAFAAPAEAPAQPDAAPDDTIQFMALAGPAEAPAPAEPQAQPDAAPAEAPAPTEPQAQPVAAADDTIQFTAVAAPTETQAQPVAVPAEAAAPAEPQAQPVAVPAAPTEPQAPPPAAPTEAAALAEAPARAEPAAPAETQVQPVTAADDVIQFMAVAAPAAPQAQRDLAIGPAEKVSARPRRGAALVAWLGLAACLALWASALRGTHLGRLQSAKLGLVSILPVTYWAALAVLMAGFAWAVTRGGRRRLLLTAHVLVLVAILHGTPAILYGSPRYSWTWKHLGVIDYITTSGIHFNLGGALGVYQGWPGFFALNSFLTAASGLHTAMSYVSWVLPLNDLLWLGPVILIARTFTPDWRFAWTAAWIFEIGNWIGQDYFSPQAFAYFLYLTVIAVCLRWLWHPRIGPPPSLADAGAGREQPRRWVMVVALIPLMAAIASSHQLTPFMLLGALILLVVFRQMRPRTLPLLMAAITAGWNLYGGLPWLKANTSQILGGMGDPWANISPHIVGQGLGAGQPAGQILVDWDSRLLSAAIGIMALIGYWRYRRRHNTQARSSWNRLLVLAVSAFPAAAANNYGGEIIFRIFLFALPFMAVAAAACFFPTPERGSSRRSATLLALTTIALVAGATLGNYGQEAMNYFNPSEVAASEWLYSTAPSGSLLLAADNNYPWAFVHYNEYNYEFLDAPASASKALLSAPVQNVTRIMARYPGPSYLILTDSQEESIRLAGLWPSGAYQGMVHALLASGKLKVVYRNGDSMVLRLAS